MCGVKPEQIDRRRMNPQQHRYSAAELEQRRAALPKPEYPEELPVSARRGDIAQAIAEHQVVIVCGETGSGKTTQLPKILLELGRGVEGLIGHTQPRRIAARATAARVAQELKTELGGAVGYKIRFNDKLSPRSYIKLMTDGILLAETQGDRDLRQYDAIIIDEAHERSLNIDFLLGYLKQLLPRRPDLKLVVTSATIDAERFSRHFNNAPVIEVSGRLYPVEIRYRPLAAAKALGGAAPRAGAAALRAGVNEVPDLADAIVDAVDEAARCGPGDVLVFLPGEREIRETAEALRKHHPPHTEILPLYARLSAAEQERVFKAHTGRRIVLATNVAETSLTVPGIRYVVDPGEARIKRYSYRSKVEQLQVENISQASANQRAGRCGRVASGVCIRLYGEDEFKARPAYTEPELLRSSLAGVILRMKSLHLGEVEDFPFLDPPLPKAVSDGYGLLAELGAVDEANDLTETGRQLARLPLDPCIARMILAAKQESCLTEALIIASVLSLQDPRERPLERAGAADAAQLKFDDEKSDFLSWLKLWKFYQEALEHKKSNRKLAELCRDNFLSYNRMREWRDIHSQLHTFVAELGWKLSEKEANYAQIHRALLAGLLGNIGCKSEDSEHYLGARGIKFLIHPGSGVGKKAGRWIMAAEITETTRLYARCVARIEPEWLESIGAHLIRRHRYEPHWEKKPAHVAAFERATLYGIVLYGNRRIHYGPLDPVESRRIFIRQALVEGEYETRAPFFQHNRKLIHDIETLEHKSRRPDVLVDEELIYAFYDSLIPEGIHNGAAFEHWRREAEAGNPKLLYLKREDLMRHEAAGITTAQFPHQLTIGARSYALDYLHDPGNARDGLTLTVPLIALNQLSAKRCDWLVPGLLKEKVALLAKTLPQKIRHKLGPLPEFAEQFANQYGAVASAEPQRQEELTLAEAIARYAREALNLTLPLDGFRPELLPAHLSMNFLVVDEHGRQLAMGRNLAQLRAELGEQAGEQFSAIAQPKAALSGIKTWDFGELQEIMEIRQGVSDPDRLSGAHRSRRQRGPRGARCAAEGARAAPRRPAAAVHAAAEGADQVSGKESARVARPGDAVPAFRRCRLAQGPVAARDFRSRLHGRAPARDAGAVCEALRRGENASHAPWPGNLPPRRQHTRRVSGAAEETAGVEEFSAGTARDRGAARASAAEEFHRRDGLGAIAAFRALPQGGGAAAGQTARRPRARCALERRIQSAVADLAARGSEAKKTRRRRSATGAVPLAAGGTARVALRAGTAHAGAGIGEAAAENVASYAKMRRESPVTWRKQCLSAP